ncbi:unnamed protein product [Musa acuminata subsp. burmannicoides]|nr:PREDICTED: dof zinc finger protein DOF4.6-like isoform X1 [Musa acuminata subsp. malaccensis]
MDRVQWSQGCGFIGGLEDDVGLLKAAEGGLVYTTTVGTMAGNSICTANRPQQAVERKVRLHKEKALDCPRCNSTNTKFCYYNNYSLTQPRYFCGDCRRYWTHGGSLRNVPVGGGSRKNKNKKLFSSSSTSSTTVSTLKKLTPAGLVSPPVSLSSTPGAPKLYEGHDLNLAFPHHSPPEQHKFRSSESGRSRDGNSNSIDGRNTCTAVVADSITELLRSGIPARGLIAPFTPTVTMEYPCGPGLQDLGPPTLNLTLVGFNASVGGGSSSGHGSLQGLQKCSCGKLLHHLEDSSANL